MMAKFHCCGLDHGLNPDKPKPLTLEVLEEQRSLILSGDAAGGYAAPRRRAIALPLLSNAWSCFAGWATPPPPGVTVSR